MKEGIEACDGADLGSANCDQVFGPGSVGVPGCTQFCFIDYAPCGPKPVCGDGKKNLPEEECDLIDLGGATCDQATGPGSTGLPLCSPQCKLDFSLCAEAIVCGNNKKQLTELCDGSDLDGKDCASFLGMSSQGQLACSSSCQFDMSGCSSCVNGVVDGSESDIDCGGLCPLRCGNSLRCNQASDCAPDHECIGDRCILAGQEVSPSSAPCDPTAGWVISLDGNAASCFKAFSASVSWFEALQACHAAASELAVFSTEAEMLQATADLALPTGGQFWVGLRCKNELDCADKAKWAWLADEPLDHDAWVPGTPDGSDEHCGRLIFENGVWRYNNQACNDHKISFICERGLQ